MSEKPNRVIVKSREVRALGEQILEFLKLATGNPSLAAVALVYASAKFAVYSAGDRSLEELLLENAKLLKQFTSAIIELEKPNGF